MAQVRDGRDRTRGRVVSESSSEQSPLCLSPDAQKRVRNRLRRLGGQVSGVERMIAEQRSCEEILAQIASLKQAASGLAGELLQEHIGQCVRSSLEAGDERQALDGIRGAVRSVLRNS